VKKPLDTETHAWGKYQHTSKEDKSDIAITRDPTPPQPPTGNFWMDTGLVVLLEPFGSELGLSYTWRNGHALVQEKLVE
jgi:hypothetical protein